MLVTVEIASAVAQLSSNCSCLTELVMDNCFQEHPTNLIPELCKQFYQLGWVTGTGGGMTIKHG